MKKSLLVLVAAAALGLAACGNGNSTQGGGDVPVKEGSITFYFELGEGSVEFKEYESIWLTGGAFGWKTGYEAVQFQQLEDSRTYYAQVEEASLDFTASQGNEYQLVIGYNEAANMPASSSGLQWIDGRKSDECAAPGGLSNPAFEYAEGDQTVNLGSHKFSNSLPTPAAPLQNYTFRVTFAQAVPEYGKVLIFGSYPGCGWVTPSGDRTDDENKAIIDGAEMTANEDRTVFTKTFESMVAGDYDCKILVEYTTAETSISWNAIDQTSDNYNFTITQADGDNYVLDILDEDATFSLQDPNAKKIPFTVTITNVGGALTAEKIYVCGDFTNWQHVEAVASGNDYVATIEGGIGSCDISFGVMSNTSWSDKVYFEGDANLGASIEIGDHASVNVTVSCDFAKLGVEPQIIAAAAVVVSYAD